MVELERIELRDLLSLLEEQADLRRSPVVGAFGSAIVLCCPSRSQSLLLANRDYSGLIFARYMQALPSCEL